MLNSNESKKGNSRSKEGNSNPRNRSRLRPVAGLLVGMFGLALTLSATAQAQDPKQDQSQQDQTQQTPPPAQAQQPPAAQQPPPDARPKPKFSSQDADKPPYSNDYPTQGAPRAHAPSPDEYNPDEDLPPQDQNAPGQNGDPQNAPNQKPPRANVPYRNDGSYSNNGPYRNGPDQAPQRQPRASAPVQPPPATLTIPAGTVLRVRVNESLSSDHSQIGDRVTATLQQPVIVNGYVVARRGQTVTGQVDVAQKAGRVTGSSQLGVELTDLTLVDGQQRPILTEMWKGSGGTTHGADAATIGSTTVLGAAIGAAADWGRGAAIGAGAGASAGIGAVLLTRGRPTVIPPETSLSFRIVDPITVDTTQSQQAFLPVSQQDYDGGGRGYRHSGQYAAGYPQQDQSYNNDCANDGPDGPCYVAPGAYPAYAYPAYGYYPGYWYPGYVGFGWGPGYYGRGYYGHGYYGRGYYGHGYHR
jgi:hypothetical protein